MQTTANDISVRSRAVRAGAVLGTLLVVALGLWEVVRRLADQVTAGAPVRSDELVVGVVASVALALTSWLAVGVLVLALASVPGAVGRAASCLAEAVTPVAVRRAVGMVLGVTVAAGVTPGACVAAAPSPASVVGLDRPHPGFVPLPDPGWVPEPPAVRPQPDLRVLAPRRDEVAPDDAVEVVVRRGDTLWSIAARHLGPHPSEAEVAHAWPAWFDTNRAVVGDDPDLLLPGQVLRAPEVTTS